MIPLTRMRVAKFCFSVKYTWSTVTMFFFFVAIFCEHNCWKCNQSNIASLSFTHTQQVEICGLKLPLLNIIMLYTTKNIFQTIIFLYSPCPNLEGIKDALSYKFRRPTIGQNCSAMCTNKGGHKNAFLNERREVLRVSRGLLSRPPILELSERQGMFFVIAWW